MESQTPEPLSSGPRPSSPRQRTASALVRSILFGLLFVPIVIAVFFAVAVVER
jgi:hypothetical protein